MKDISIGSAEGALLKRLLVTLADRRRRYQPLDMYLSNDAGIPHMADKAVRAAYQRLMRMAGTNYPELVVEAPRERMAPIGFRTGVGGDEVADAEAWRIWQANSLDADSGIVHRTSLGLGDAYVIVGPVDPDIGAAVITYEDPRQVLTVHDPRIKRKVTAAVVNKVDTEAGAEFAWLHLPGLVMQAARPIEAGAPPWSAAWRWERAYVVPFNDISVVRFPNQQGTGRPDGLGDSWGEFERHVSVIDRINYTILSRLEIATMQAFKQRAIKGAPSKDADGKAIDYSDIFSADPGAMWLLPATAEMWESGAVDMSGIRQSVRDDVLDLAAVTRTPLFYLAPDAAGGSAEGASLAREGLTFKTADRIMQASDPWERVMSLAFQYAGDTERARLAGMEVIWRSPERMTMEAKYDAAVKAKAAGVPWQTRMEEILQYTPQQIERMRRRFPENQQDNPDDESASVGDQADALGVLIRAGVDPKSAAEIVALYGTKFTGAVPTSLRVPQTDAASLESA